MRLDSLFDGKYKILRLLGAGGCGRVYLAENVRLRSLWAIKEVPFSEASLQQIEHEIDALKRIRHSALPRIVDIVTEGSAAYIVEDYMEGQTLEQLVSQGGRIDEAAAVKWGADICEVMAFLHAQKPEPIIYRDLKPSNIIIGSDGAVRLVDFGSARNYKEGGAQDTVYIGTRGYAAPEQYGLGQTSVRSDVYSFGVTMLRVLTGASPQAPAASEPCGARPQGVSEALWAVLAKCAAEAAEDRYGDFCAVKAALLDAAEAPAGALPGRQAAWAPGTPDAPTRRYAPGAPARDYARELPQTAGAPGALDAPQPASAEWPDHAGHVAEPAPAGACAPTRNYAPAPAQAAWHVAGPANGASATAPDRRHDAPKPGDGVAARAARRGASDFARESVVVGTHGDYAQELPQTAWHVAGRDSAAFAATPAAQAGAVAAAAPQPASAALANAAPAGDLPGAPRAAFVRSLILSVLLNHEFAFELAFCLSASLGLRTLLLNLDFECPCQAARPAGPERGDAARDSLLIEGNGLRRAVDAAYSRYRNSGVAAPGAGACAYASAYAGAYAAAPACPGCPEGMSLLEQGDAGSAADIQARLLGGDGGFLRYFLAELAAGAQVCIVLAGGSILGPLAQNCLRHSDCVLYPARLDIPRIRAFNATGALAESLGLMPADKMKFVAWDYSGGETPSGEYVYELRGASLIGAVRRSKKRDAARCRPGSKIYAAAMERNVRNDYRDIIRALGIGGPRAGDRQRQA